MKTLLVICALASGYLHAAESNDAVEFTGSLQHDSSAATKFSVSVPAGQVSKLTLPDGTELEFSAAAANGTPNQSVVRLLDPSGNKLHTAIAPGNAPAVKSVRYTICGSQVTFESPIHTVSVACPKGKPNYSVKWTAAASPR